MGKIGFYRRRSEEEVAWGKDALARIATAGKPIGRLTFNELNLCSDFKRKFGREISADALYAWLKKLSGHKCASKEKRNTKEFFTLLEKSKYILYIFNEGIYGFETKDEVKNDLLLRKPTAPMVLFSSIPVTIKHSVDVQL